jgi:hypothetical protein
VNNGFIAPDIVPVLIPLLVVISVVDVFAKFTVPWEKPVKAAPHIRVIRRSFFI